jgi:hypothetical protein
MRGFPGWVSRADGKYAFGWVTYSFSSKYLANELGRIPINTTSNNDDLTNEMPSHFSRLKCVDVPSWTLTPELQASGWRRTVTSGGIPVPSVEMWDPGRSLPSTGLASSISGPTNPSLPSLTKPLEPRTQRAEVAGQAPTRPKSQAHFGICRWACVLCCTCVHTHLPTATYLTLVESPRIAASIVRHRSS